MLRRLRNAVREAETLEVLQAATIVVVLAAYSITTILVRQTRAVEANPVKAWLFETVGWTATGLVSVALFVVCFGLYLEFDSRGYERAARVGAVGLSLVAAVDFAINLWVLSVVGVPPMSSSAVVPIALVGLGVGVAVSYPELCEVVRSVQVKRAAAIGLALLVVVSSVGIAAAAIGTVDSFDDNDISEYDVYKSDGTVTTQSSTVLDGTHALKIDANGGNSNPAIYSASGLENYPSSGDSFEIHGRFDGASDSTGNTLQFTFAGQSNKKDPNGYTISLKFSDSTVGLYKEGSGGGAIDEQSTSISESEWIRIYVDWSSAGDFIVVFEDSSGSEFAELSGSDASFSSGGFYVQGDTQTSGETYFVDEINLVSSEVTEGTVTNESGAAVSGATVTAYNSSTGNEAYNTTTASDGTYSMNLDAGGYDIEVSNTSYANKTKSVSVSGSGTTIDFCLGSCGSSSDTYTQEFVLKDHTGHFPNGSSFTVYEETTETYQGSVVPTGPDDWETTESTSFNSFGKAYVDLEPGRLYRLEVENGDALYSEAGFNASDTDNAYTVEIGEPSSGTPTPTPTPTNGSALNGTLRVVECADGSESLCIRYDGEQVSKLDANVTGPDGATVYDVNRTFEENRSYVEYELNESLDNTSATDPSEYSVEYAGEFADSNTSFNGSSDVGEELSVFGDGSVESEAVDDGDGGLGGGGGIVPEDSGGGAPVAATAAVPVVAIGYLLYRRRQSGV